MGGRRSLICLQPGQPPLIRTGQSRSLGVTLLSAPRVDTSGLNQPSWHGSAKGSSVCWDVIHRHAHSLEIPLPKARRPVQTWQLWATAAAISAAVTALLIKVGVQGVDAGLATLFRTVVVAVVLGLVLLASGRLDWQELRHLPPASLTALALSGLATGVSWFCYSRALQLGPVARGGGARQAQCRLDRGAGPGVSGRAAGPQSLARGGVDGCRCCFGGLGVAPSK